MRLAQGFVVVLLLVIIRVCRCYRTSRYSFVQVLDGKLQAFIENPTSRHEHIPRAIDEPVTGTRHVLAVAGVIAVERSGAIKVAVVSGGNSVDVARAVIACHGRAEGAGCDLAYPPEPLGRRFIWVEVNPKSTRPKPAKKLGR